MDPLISVIIPVYNVEKYLQQCLESVRKQNYKNIEVLMIDDGSRDQSGDICDKMTEKDSRFYVYHQNNQGVSAARNLGLKKASGEYVIFIDSDDWIPANYIESLETNRNSCELVICSIAGYKKMSSREFSFQNYNDDIFVEWNKIFILYGPHCKLYDYNIIKQYKISFPLQISYGEDLIFNYKYMEYINKIKYIDTTHYYYRSEVENSLSKRFRFDFFENGKRLNKVIIDFLTKKQITSDRLIQYCYDRIFDDAYNAIFQIFHPDFKGNIVVKYQYIKKILCDDELIEAYKYADLQKYSTRIVTYMRRKSIIKFIIYGSFGRTLSAKK